MLTKEREQIKNEIIMALSKLGISKEASKLFIEREEIKYVQEMKHHREIEELKELRNMYNENILNKKNDADRNDLENIDIRKTFFDDHSINVIPTFEVWKNELWRRREDQ
jgi:hypothetical protein